LGAHIFFDWQDSELYLVKALGDWMKITRGFEPLQQILDAGIRASPFLLTGALFCTLVGSLMLLLGWWIRLGALLLLLVSICATPLMYPFWTLNGLEAQIQSAFFVKNVGIIGGLLLLFAYGKGGCKMNQKSAQKNPKIDRS
jgi:uncharacterized membrane protein YphA (DoxX/SURF4 family)